MEMYFFFHESECTECDEPSNFFENFDHESHFLISPKKTRIARLFDIKDLGVSYMFFYFLEIFIFLVYNIRKESTFPMLNFFLKYLSFF